VAAGAVYAGYAGVCLVFLAPLLWVASLSLRPLSELFTVAQHLLPENPTLDAYRQVLFHAGIGIYLINSLKFVVATIIGALLMAVPAAYALSRLRFASEARRRWVMLMILAVQLISPLAIALPLYRYFSAVGLIDSQVAVVLVYIALGSPFATWMLAGFLDTVPTALDEAARIDGCSRLQALRLVLLPLMLPGLASTAILLAINTWGQFIVPFVLLSRERYYPISVGILQFQSSTDAVSTNLLAAAAILSALPAVLIFLLLQRFIIGALTAGALKG
jgi:multiple sugar transport system permease protein